MKRRNPYSNNNNYSRPPRPSPHDVLKRRICEIGEPSNFSLSSSIENLGRLLEQIEEQSALRHTALNSIAAVVREQPHKIPIIGASVCLANAAKPLVGQIILEMTHSEVQKAVDQGNWTNVKLFTRFVAVMSALIEGSGVYSLLETILNLAIENADSDVGQELYVLVLLTLPILYVTPGSEKSRVKDIYKASKAFTVPEFDTALLEPYTGQGKPYQIQTFVEVVQKSLDNIDVGEWATSNGTSLGHLLQVETFLENSSAPYKDSKKHTFPSVSFEKGKGKLTRKYASAVYQYGPRLVSRFYLPNPFETVPPVDSFENVLLRDIGTDLIQGMDFNRREVARQLITLDLFFELGTFTEPGITMDRLEKKVKDAEEAKTVVSTWKVEDCALEVVLDHLFRLPKTVHYPAYYHSILIEMCIMAPEAVAPVFGRAVRFLFKNIDSLDLQLYHVFLNWFSHHLTNFDFVWKWKEWLEFESLEDIHPKKSFIKQLIAKELRLSYPQRVEESLIEEFKKYVLSDEEQDPVMKWLEPESGYEDVVNDFLKALREVRAKQLGSKPSSASADTAQSDVDETVAQALEAINQKVTEDSVGGLASSLDLKLVEIIVSSVCHIGNRSISHAKDWVKRCSGIVKPYTRGGNAAEGAQRQAIVSILDYWKGQPKVGSLVVQYFVQAEIIEPATLIDVLLSDESIITSHGYEQVVWLVDEYPALLDEILNAVKARISEDPSTKWWLEGLKTFLERQQTYPALDTSIPEDEEMADEKDKAELKKPEIKKDVEKASDEDAEKDAGAEEDEKSSDNNEPQAKRTKTD